MGIFSTSGAVAVIGIVLYFHKMYTNGPMCPSEARMDGKVVMVTGANSGIGRETAAELARRGAKVYLTARTLTEGLRFADHLVQEHPEVNPRDVMITLLEYDSMEDVDGFLAAVKKKQPKIDVIIHNAGVYKYERSETMDGLETTLAVNHLGPFYVTLKLLDELLAAGPGARIISVTSPDHVTSSGYVNIDDPMYKNNWNAREAYANSKLASMILMKELGRRLKEHGISTFSVAPGSVLTNISREAPIMGLWPVRPVIEAMLYPFCKDPMYGAQSSIWAAVDPALHNKTWAYYSSEFTETESSAAGLYDDAHAQDVWDMSMKLLNLRPDQLHHKLRIKDNNDNTNDNNDNINDNNDNINDNNNNK